MNNSRTVLVIAIALLLSPGAAVADHHGGGYSKSGYGGNYNDKNKNRDYYQSKYSGKKKKYKGSHEGHEGNTLVIDGKRVSVDEFFKEQQKRGN